MSAFLGAIVHVGPGMVEPVADASTYEAIATGLVGQRPYGEYYDLGWAIGGLTCRGLLYPLFLVPFYALAGEPVPELAGWFQALLLVPLTTILVFFTGRAAFSKGIGLLAAWGFALWFPAAWHTRYLLTETLVDLLLVAVLVLVALTIARKSRRAALAAGLALGALSITHGAFQFLPLVMVLALGAHFALVDRRALPLAALTVVGVLCVHAPYVAVRTLADLPSLGQGAQGYGGGAGWTFYVGSRAETGFIPVPDDYQIGDLSAPGQLQEVAARLARGELQIEPELASLIRERAAGPGALRATLTDGDYLRAGLRNLWEHPSKLPEKLQLNAATLFLLPSGLQAYGPTEALGPSFQPAEVRWYTKAWRPLSAVLFALTVLGLSYLLLFRRDRLVLAVPFVLQAGILLAALVEPRYAVPLWSSMFFLAAVGVAGWWSLLRSGARTDAPGG